MPLISTGLMCYRGWRGTPLNPSNIPIVSREYMHQPSNAFKDLRCTSLQPASCCCIAMHLPLSHLAELCHVVACHCDIGFHPPADVLHHLPAWRMLSATSGMLQTCAAPAAPVVPVTAIFERHTIHVCQHATAVLIYHGCVWPSRENIAAIVKPQRLEQDTMAELTW